MSVAPTTVSRLSPCPCGSGKRYKDCHGALAAQRASARSRAYRPTGQEWDHLSEDERERLGALMEAALVHQRAGQMREAGQYYQEVLAVAPTTHDALHMLAMVRYSEGNLVEARRLIEEALMMRPEYPVILQNRSIVVSAQRARERSAQEALCEKALPRLFDLVRAEGADVRRGPSGATTVQLIGVDDGSQSDDAWMLRRLVTLLSPANPAVSPNGGDGSDVRLPEGGVPVWVGADVDVPSWRSQAQPRRTIVFAQSASPSRWLETLRAIGGDGSVPLELVVESKAKSERFGGGHHVLPPPIDLAEFAAEWDLPPPGDAGAFVVGNVIQDGRSIARARTGSLQERIAMAGFRLNLYDPGRFRYTLGARRNVRCFSRHDVTLAQFLAPLSCYLYRCESWWAEGLGRDLFGAMAQGVAVLCPRTSIYAEYVRDGIDGILYDDDASALAGVAQLRDDPARCATLGAKARASARRLFEPAELAASYRRVVLGA